MAFERVLFIEISDTVAESPDQDQIAHNYGQTDLDLHCLQGKSIVTKGSIRVNTKLPSKMTKLKTFCLQKLQNDSHDGMHLRQGVYVSGKGDFHLLFNIPHLIK